MDPEDTINLPTDEDLANGIYPGDEGHPFEDDWVDDDWKYEDPTYGDEEDEE